MRQQRDPQTSQIQYEAFLGNWIRHYGMVKQLVPALGIQRFVCLVEYANVLNLWSHTGLRQVDVPYVLLALAGFIRQPGTEGGSTWVHFFFDRRIRDVSDLWLPERAEDVQFFRMIYLEPVLTPFPTGAQMICWEVLDRDGQFMTGDLPGVSSRDVRAFERFIATPAVRE
ncbi:hypothetical protein [Burkholderia sp. WAC0059]|uniref:hypothetical protein n=1 Tax=Burkholderia sp. WAC0059 TaxID=2066022 RepID=UPI0011AFB08E|nr:hypothetical protein [Burkholderia sp. WAC0059]